MIMQGGCGRRNVLPASPIRMGAIFTAQPRVTCVPRRELARVGIDSPQAGGIKGKPPCLAEAEGDGIVAENPIPHGGGDPLAAREVERLNDEWVRALEARDIAALDRIMADDFVFTHPMEGDDKGQFLADVESGDVRVGHMGRDNVTVFVFGDTAVLSCRDTARWQYRGRDFTGVYKTIHVYARRDGQWRLVAIQSCHYS